jgi:hypothetical protein
MASSSVVLAVRPHVLGWAEVKFAAACHLTIAVAGN